MAVQNAQPVIDVADAAGRYTPTPLSALKALDGKDVFACGTGNLAFDISQIKADLTTTPVTTAGPNAGLSVPVKLVTIGAKGSYSTSVTNTQTLTYQVWPVDEKDQNPALRNYHPTAQMIEGAPIAHVLTDLRKALIASATRFDYAVYPPRLRPPKPCFTDYSSKDIAHSPAHTYTLGLSIVRDASGSVSVDVSVLSLGAGGESKSTTGNTLTVSFMQAGLADLQKAQEAKATACAKGKEKSRACQGAAIKEAVVKRGQIGIPNLNRRNLLPGLDAVR